MNSPAKVDLLLMVALGGLAALLGTVQLGTGMLFSLLAAFLYNHTMNVLVGMIVFCSLGATFVAFRFKRH